MITEKIDFDKSVQKFFDSSKVDISKKAELYRVLSQIDAHSAITLSEPVQKRMEEELKKYSNFKVFEELAKNKNKLEEFEKAKKVSFEFEPFLIPKEGIKFVMGSPETEKDRGSDEQQRYITITKPFEIQRTPITQRQWELVMGNNPAHFKEDLDRPIETVSWNEAQEFIKKLNELDPNYTYRLPTEAERELATKAGTKTRFSFGNSDEKLKEYGWFNGNSESKTHTVASLKSNPNGLYDVHGNVWEWCQDWYTSEAFKLPSTDPTGPETGSRRVVRGGSWGYVARDLRSSERGYGTPDGRVNFVGLRVVRTKK
jgi:formylglycine-generating enzyme required for sulfatase activity